MTGRWKTCAIAGMTAFTTAVVLLAGVSAARADELADLRANQELLQRRIDQLAQAAGPGLAKPQLPPGTPSIAGSFPRSFLIPGTDTSIAFSGFVHLTGLYGFSGASPNSNNAAGPPVSGNPTTAGAALDLHGTGLFAPPFFNPHSRGSGTFRMSAADSRFRIETRTPTAYGSANTLIEADFFGCTAGQITCNNIGVSTNPDLLRLRYAFGTLGGFGAGQYDLPVTDNRSHAELIDFGGETGNFGFARTPQIRYTGQLPYGLSYIVGVVNPLDQIYTPAGNIEDDSVAGQNGATAALPINPTKNTLPDGNFVLEAEQPWGHLRINGVVRKLELNDGHFISKEYIGYGGGFAGALHPAWFGWEKDNLGFEGWAGSGLGHYGAASGASSATTQNALATNFGGPGMYGSTACSATGAPAATCSLAAAKGILAGTVTQWGGQVNYQHWWTPTLRSTVSTGLSHVDVPTNLIGTTSTNALNDNKELWTAHANLIWSPVAFINTGVEYIHGHRTTALNAKGDINQLLFDFRVRF